jgi:hypothetical protein
MSRRNAPRSTGCASIRTQAMDAVQKAKSGHPDTPMALAPVAYTLWQRAPRYDCADPNWPNRDRTGRRFHTRRETIFRVAGAAAAELAEPPDVVEADRRSITFVGIADPRRMQKCVKQHRGVAV